ncbi:MAG: anaerobic ribonucleoside-triphosphate reductase activating protein [Candidatus Gracilibacteria bacterium]|nr:anaerobic ribonucleoside-triphosphate reductase activating protein [Candidatus Gracilibacteria bacterium]
MQISAINKFSLIEFPGEISTIVFTPGCNFRCDYCHNSEFVLPEKLKNVYKNLIMEKAFFNFLEKRKGNLTGVSICGGEPTMQSDLKEFCRKVKSFGYKVKLDTNGRDPKIIKELLDEDLVDYIAMDIKYDIGNFSFVAGIKLDEDVYLETIRFLLNSNIDYEFRTTLIKGIHNENIIENISKYISGAKNYYLQNYRSGNTLNPDFKGESFSQSELERFKNISSKYIKNVGIRN